eukprot:m51a1_g10605 hypothetical protein (105) ;mRNA; f:39130-39444
MEYAKIAAGAYLGLCSAVYTFGSAIGGPDGPEGFFLTPSKIQAAIESGMPVTVVLGPLVSSYLTWHFGHGPTLYMLGTSASCAGFTAMYFLTEKMRNRSAGPKA